MGRHHSHAHTTALWVSRGDSSPTFMTLGWLILTYVNRVGSIVLLQGGAGPALLSVAAGQGQNQLSHLPQVLMGEQ